MAAGQAQPGTPRVGWRGAVLPVVLLLAAEWALRQDAAPSDALARPSEVLQTLLRALADGSLLRYSAETLGAALGGLALGGGVGLALGLWLGLSRRAAQAASLSVELLRPLPSVALIPIAMLVFGFGFRMEIAVTAFTCFWPMLLLSQSAVRQVEPRLLDVAQVLGLHAAARVWKIVLPAALPRVFVAFRLSVGIALVVAVTAEITANPQGLGYALISAQQSLQPAMMFAVLLWIGLLGAALGAGLLAVQRRWFGAALGEGVPA